MTTAINIILFFGIILFIGYLFSWVTGKINAFSEQRQWRREVALAKLITTPLLIRSQTPFDTHAVAERGLHYRSVLAASCNTWITPEDIWINIYEPDGAGQMSADFDTWCVAVDMAFAQYKQQKKAEHLKRTGQMEWQNILYGTGTPN